LGLFVTKDDGAFLLRRRDRFSWTKHSTLSPIGSYETQEVEYVYIEKKRLYPPPGIKIVLVRDLDEFFLDNRRGSGYYNAIC